MARLSKKNATQGTRVQAVRPITLIPSSASAFKRALLHAKIAWITVYYVNGKKEIKKWNARKFDENSDVMGNLRSRLEFGKDGWQRQGIARVVVSISKPEESHDKTTRSTDMTRDELLTRISIDPNICFGKPCVRGHRIWVSLILDFLANGWSIPDILANYPGLEEADVRACLAYGAEMARERYVEIAGVGSDAGEAR
jgi:uncharacterized protein (DUF433 family)